ncbi:MAG: hypothetical protein ABSG15_04275 [FCB group bacterium]|jgi:hypothetical protein
MRRKICFLFVICLSFLIAINLYSQGSAGAKAKYESRYIVDMPTAGVIPKYSYSASAIIQSNGGLMIEVDASPLTNINLGISYSGSGIIGNDGVNWQRQPGYHLSVRLFDEKIYFPAILIGLNTQGSGNYINSQNRFQTLSPGLYAALSKSYIWKLGTIAFHGGVTYSFEPPQNDRSPNLYAGLEHSIGNNASFNIEYNPTLDDNNKAIMKKKGMLNASFRWVVTSGFTLEFQAKDLLKNYAGSTDFTRNIKLEYINLF